MGKKSVVLFPDTNLFLQCRPLNELDWHSLLPTYNEIYIFVLRPVQREIDKHKNRGNDRAGRRARTTASMFKQIISSQKDYVINDSNPLITMRIRPDLRWSSFDERLDPHEADDQIIAIADAFSKSHPEKMTYLITHDSGPMGTASMLGVNFIPIPDDWLEKPELSEHEKQVRKLSDEVSRLRQQEPIFKNAFANDDLKHINRLDETISIFLPLPKDCINQLVENLKQKFPIVTDFSSKTSTAQRSKRTVSEEFLGIEKEFLPPSFEEIEDYKTKYNEWVIQCRNIFAALHTDLNNYKEIVVHFLSNNTGTRPARDALVSFRACGNFLITVPPDNRIKRKGKKKLPSYPQAPFGKWVSRSVIAEISSYKNLFGLSAYNDKYALLQETLRANYGRPSLSEYLNTAEPFLPRIPSIEHHDANDFFYKPNRPIKPEKSFELECRQWRHGQKIEDFSCEIHFDRSVNKIKGILEVVIHAENLSDSAVTRLPIEITIEHLSSMTEAEQLIAEMGA